MSWVRGNFEHLQSLDMPTTENDIRDTLEDSEEMNEWLYRWSRTLLIDDHPIAVVGIEPQWAGVGKAWTYLTLESLKHTIGITRSMLKLLTWIEKDEDMHRIEASVDKKNKVAIRWIKYLGFKYEGDMPNYGLGGVGTFARFARLN